MSRPVLVLGLAPSPSQADGGTFWGSPSGMRLERIIDSVWIPHWPAHHTDFANVWQSALRDPRTLTHARFQGTRAERLAHAACAGRHVLVLGELVCQLMWRYVPPLGGIAAVQSPWGDGAIVCHFPHPSPRNRFWNEPDSLARAVVWARAFYNDWRAAETTAQGKGA